MIQIINLSLPNLLLYAFQIDTFSKHAILCKLRTLFGIPNLFIFNVITISFTGEQICSPTLSDYIKYFTYFVNPVLTFGLPLIMISTFDILTWINITKLGGQRTAIIV